MKWSRPRECLAWRWWFYTTCTCFGGDSCDHPQKPQSRHFFYRVLGFEWEVKR
ncbi:hypothetical protein LCGC14_1235500 [marine sediment metagenome]|uniref:Uncharacterized protein n=1 Tax=marine sediment metagenome TaxID=412755 RepID=A0A0F9LUK7_9ZZZZ